MVRRRRASTALGLACAVAFAMSATLVSAGAAGSARAASPSVAPSAVSATSAYPLAGLVIALDPGHNKGNATHTRQINRKVWVGFWKACDTTGTATNGGYAEANFTWDVALRTKKVLESLGARVILTRTSNTYSSWGPCIDYRGRFGTAQHAVLKVGIHGDGAPSSGRGFHVIRPGYRKGYTDDILSPSKRLAYAMKKGLIAGGITPSTYISGAMTVRTDLGTLNMANVPSIITELGNMRNSRDAKLMTSPTGRQHYANALVRGIRLYLNR
jgi:N-acetylmuramoyl-L-alanine amidase